MIVPLFFVSSSRLTLPALSPSSSWFQSWTESYVAWSPKGSYLATFHEPGIMLWGGLDFARLARFSHAHVKRIDFSPCERFLVTCSGDEPEVSCRVVL